MSTALDLFSGPRGWDVGARMAGLPDALGIDVDEAACATSEAAGFPTLRADVAELDPLDFAPCELLIASPPCQAWSMAGKRQGQLDIAHVYGAAKWIAGVEPPPDREPEQDPRSRLVVEPLRWALALKPRRMAWEQVPPVLEFWQFCARLLRDVGYSVWTGVLSAERFGVPQTRKRAILMASLDGPVDPPAPTHQAYVPGEPAEEQHTLEGTLAPWVSMADALGWQEGRVRTNNFTAKQPERKAQGAGNQPRPIEVPAATLDTRTDLATWVSGLDPKQTGMRERPADEPAPTLMGAKLAKDGPEWVGERPATTVAGDPRVAQPGHKRDEANPDSPGRMQDAVRVTLEEAAVLQGFPPDYPFQGSRTKQFEQVGNAVPPPLAAAVLASLVPVELREAA